MRGYNFVRGSFQIVLYVGMGARDFFFFLLLKMARLKNYAMLLIGPVKEKECKNHGRSFIVIPSPLSILRVWARADFLFKKGKW